MNQIEAITLGATLFVRANHTHLESIVFENKYPDLRSIVIDFEDGLHGDDVKISLKRFKTVLDDKRAFGVIVIVRVRNATMLDEILMYSNINKIDAYIFPKFSLLSMDKYLLHVKKYSLQFMPSIEGLELFDVNKLKALRDELLTYKEHVILIRFGAEDMMRQLGLKRDCEHSLFDMKVTSHCITTLIMTFKPYEFSISAPVFICFKDDKNYIKQIEEEFREGLITKTIIHPNQIAPLHALYQVSQEDLSYAQSLLTSDKAVFASNEQMAEVTTQSLFAEQILQRFKLFGCRVK